MSKMSKINDEITMVVKALSQLKKNSSDILTLGTDSIPQEIWNDCRAVIRLYLGTELSWDTAVQEESNVSDVIQQLCDAMDQFLFSSNILVLAEAIVAMPDCCTLSNTAKPGPHQTMKDTPTSLMVEQTSVQAARGQMRISPGLNQVDDMVITPPKRQACDRVKSVQHVSPSPCTMPTSVKHPPGPQQEDIFPYIVKCCQSVALRSMLYSLLDLVRDAVETNASGQNIFSLSDSDLGGVLAKEAGKTVKQEELGEPPP